MSQVSVPDSFTHLVSLLWSPMDEVDFDLWLAMFTRRAARHFGFEPPEYELLNYGERSADEVLADLDSARSELRLAVEELRSARATLPDATPEQLAEVVPEPAADYAETIPVAAPLPVVEPEPPVLAVVEEPPVAPPVPGLTDKQARIMDALRESGGRQADAARLAGVDPSSVSGTVWALRDSGRLPADVDALLTARRDERLGARPAAKPAGPAQTLINASRNREREAVAAVAVRHPEPAQNEKTGETFEERRARIAHEQSERRARIAHEQSEKTWAARHPAPSTGLPR